MWKSLERRTGEEDSGVQAVTVRSAAPCFPVATFVRMAETERRIFLCRYWYLDSISDIASYYGFTDSKVTSMLHRTRKKLRAVLEKEGLL